MVCRFFEKYHCVNGAVYVFTEKQKKRQSLRACLISQRVRIGEIDFMSCKAKSRSNPDGLQGFLTQSGRKICRQGGRGEILNRL